MIKIINYYELPYREVKAKEYLPNNKGIVFYCAPKEGVRKEILMAATDDEVERFKLNTLSWSINYDSVGIEYVVVKRAKKQWKEVKKN